MVPIYSQVSQFHPPVSYIFRIHINIIFQSTLRFLKWYFISNQNSVISIENEQQARQSRVRNLAEERDFFCSEKDTEQVWGPSYILCSGYRGSLPSVKWPERDVEESPPSNVEVTKKWSCTSNPPYAFMTWTRTTLTFNSMHLPSHACYMPFLSLFIGFITLIIS
jgi:predicted transglutaminase-like protease